MTRPTRRISLFVYEDQLEALSQISESTGAPQSELIRRAIASFLTSKEVKDGQKAKFAGDEIRSPDS